MTWADLDPEIRAKAEIPWTSLNPEIRAAAEEACTEKELAALKFWHADWSYREMAPMLGVKAWETARDRVKRALRKTAVRKVELDEEKRQREVAA